METRINIEKVEPVRNKVVLGLRKFIESTSPRRMKNLMYVLILAGSGLVIQDCKGSNHTRNAADTPKRIKDTIVNIAAAGGISVANEDAIFFTTVTDDGMAEVALGKLAIYKTSSQEIREFAGVMVIDHSKINDGLMQIAKDENISLPTRLGEEHRKKMNALSKMSSKEFDGAYVDAIIEGHKKMLDLLQNELNQGELPALKAFAARTVSTIQMHLYAIERIQDSMK